MARQYLGCARIKFLVITSTSWYVIETDIIKILPQIRLCDGPSVHPSMHINDGPAMTDLHLIQHRLRLPSFVNVLPTLIRVLVALSQEGISDPPSISCISRLLRGSDRSSRDDDARKDYSIHGILGGGGEFRFPTKTAIQEIDLKSIFRGLTNKTLSASLTPEFLPRVTFFLLFQSCPAV